MGINVQLSVMDVRNFNDIFNNNFSKLMEAKAIMEQWAKENSLPVEVDTFNLNPLELF